MHKGRLRPSIVQEAASLRTGNGPTKGGNSVHEDARVHTGNSPRHANLRSGLVRVRAEWPSLLGE